MSDKLIKALIAEAVKGNTYKNFTTPLAASGKTAFHKTSGEQERYCIQFDYNRVVNKDWTNFHIFKMQPNKGHIPTSIKAWRDKHSTDAIMAVVWVKNNASVEEVKAALDTAREKFKESS